MNLPEDIRYLAIEGVIGVGKSTLSEIISDRTGARLLLEQFAENPFLEKFYKDNTTWAFQTQLFFLLSRHKQFSEYFSQQDLFIPLTVADYTFDKDRIFALNNLSEPELDMYDKVADVLRKDVVSPDLIIYLQADIETLINRIHKRGRSMEKDIDPEYLENLIRIYDNHFFRYRECPVLIVNTSNIDFVENEEDLEGLLMAISEVQGGVNFHNPISNL